VCGWAGTLGQTERKEIGNSTLLVCPICEKPNIFLDDFMGSNLIFRELLVSAKRIRSEEKIRLVAGGKNRLRRIERASGD